MKKVKATFAIFKNLASERIKAAQGPMTPFEAYAQLLAEIKQARSLKSHKKTRDEHGRLIRRLIESIDEISGNLFAKNFQVTDKQRLQILELMIDLDEAILIYPFGRNIKLVPTVDSLEVNILPDFEEALEISEIDNHEGLLALMEVETEIYRWREIAEKNRLERLELGYQVVTRLKERSEDSKK